MSVYVHGKIGSRAGRRGRQPGHGAWQGQGGSGARPLPAARTFRLRRARSFTDLVWVAEKSRVWRWRGMLATMAFRVAEKPCGHPGGGGGGRRPAGWQHGIGCWLDAGTSAAPGRAALSLLTPLLVARRPRSARPSPTPPAPPHTVTLPRRCLPAALPIQPTSPPASLAPRQARAAPPTTTTTTTHRSHHVQDPVRLIQHQHLQLAGIKAGRLVHVLQQPPRGAHQDVHACAAGEAGGAGGAVRKEGGDQRPPGRGQGALC